MAQTLRDAGAITYREATGADVDTLANLRWRMETERHPEHPATDDNHALYLEAAQQDIRAEIERGAHIAFLAEADGEVVACAILIWWTMLPTLTELHRKRGYVSSVYTAPGWRRNGIARALMERLIARAQEMRVQRLILKASDMGRPLYLDLGFAPSHALEWNE
jgi:ribosomal protein S18 acetylase RimI-like enzyme